MDRVWDDDSGLGSAGAVGGGSEDGNEDNEDDDDDGAKRERKGQGERRSRHGKWESGQGRCAVTGRRVLGGTEGLRRVMV